MKKTIFFRMFIVLTICSTYAQANYTFQPSDADLFDLAHKYFYIWTITPSIPNGENIEEASISFRGINNWRIEPDDKMYIRLLSEAEIEAAVNAKNMSNVSGFNGDIYRGTDFAANGDELNGYGDLLTIYEDDNEYKSGWFWINPPEDFTYTFDQAEIDLLNSYLSSDSMFGIALDPDCWYVPNYSNCFIEVELDTSVIPVPGPIILGSIGVVLVGWLRSRKTL
jgi:hypothetical protein